MSLEIQKNVILISNGDEKYLISKENNPTIYKIGERLSDEKMAKNKAKEFYKLQTNTDYPNQSHTTHQVITELFKILKEEV